jgi:hypothetical protein
LEDRRNVGNSGDGTDQKVQSLMFMMMMMNNYMPIPVSAQYKWVCDCLLAGTRLGVRIPPGARMFVCCESCVLSGRVLCNGLIPTKCDVSKRDGEASILRRPLPKMGCCAMGDNI